MSPNPMYSTATVDTYIRSRTDGLGAVRELLLQRRDIWADRIIPFAVEFVSDNVDDIELVVRDLDASGVHCRIEFATDR